MVAGVVAPPLIVGVSLFIGMTPAVAPSFYAGLPGSVSIVMAPGISAGCPKALVFHQMFRSRTSAALALAPQSSWPSPVR